MVAALHSSSESKPGLLLAMGMKQLSANHRPVIEGYPWFYFGEDEEGKFAEADGETPSSRYHPVFLWLHFPRDYCQRRLYSQTP